MSRIATFLEDRLGLVSACRAAMFEKRPPAGIGWLRTFGWCALTVAILQLLSGIALAFHYVPSADLAYDSIRALENDVPGGAFVRSLHHFGASGFIILLVLHVARVFFTGAYKKPREVTWITGVLLLFVVLAFGFTGYLLPWDQKAYFATKVGTTIAGQAPLVGESVRQVLDGGNDVGPPTLTRFYVIHVVLLPIALLALLGAHLFLIQRHGVAAPGRMVGDEGTPGPTYFPHHVMKEAIAGLVITGVLFGLAATYHAPLEAMAEASDTGYQPRPDWYFLGLFQLLKVFKGPLEPIGAFWLPNAILLLALLLPFLDRSPHRHWRQRPLWALGGAAFALAVGGLTLAGALDAPHNRATLRHPLGLTANEREGYLLVRSMKCTNCHSYEQPDGTVIGGSDEHPDAPHLDEIDYSPDDLAYVIANPKDALGDETEMPSFDYLPYEQRRAIGVYLRRLVADGAARADGSVR